jgi:hypothetical protein
VAEDVIRARRIELLDDEGEVNIVLAGGNEGRMGLMVSTSEENALGCTLLTGQLR